jgi:hypothetical protein
MKHGAYQLEEGKSGTSDPEPHCRGRYESPPEAAVVVGCRRQQQRTTPLLAATFASQQNELPAGSRDKERPDQLGLLFFSDDMHFFVILCDLVPSDQSRRRSSICASS